MEPFDFQTKLNAILLKLPNSDEISLNEIINSNLIPIPYKTFIAKEIDRQLSEFSFLLNEMPLFSKKSNDLQNLLSRFTADLKQHITFSFEHFKGLLLQALKFNYNFLRKPNSSLLYFIFGDSLRKNKNEILFYLDYFVNYDKIVDPLRETTTNQEDEIINVYRFNKLLVETEIKFFNNASNDDLIAFFAPVFEFYNQGEEANSVPIGFFTDFFEDLNLLHISNSIQNFCKRNGTESVDKDVLSHFLLEIENKFNFITDFEKEQTAKRLSKSINFTSLEPFVFTLPDEVPKVDKELLEVQETDSTLLVAKKEEVDEIKELLSKFDTEKQIETEEVEIDEVVSVANEEQRTESENLVEDSISSPQEIQSIETGDIEEFVPPNPEQAESFLESTKEEMEVDKQEEYISETQGFENEQKVEESSFDTTSSVEETCITTEQVVEPAISVEEVIPSTFPSFNDLIDEAKRKQFIEELFYTMEEEYNNLVANIDNSDNLEKALEFVNNYFAEFGVFPEMPIAKEFVDTVRRKFS
ncbi:MAG: hypothetical protein ACK42G_02945 [Candidatus Kapaibacteriota bacterium]